MQEFEKWLARVLLLNGLLTLGVCLGWLGEPHSGMPLAILIGVAMLGIGAAALALKQQRLGWYGALLYYGVQVVSYYAYDGSAQWAVKAGVSLGMVLHLASGVVVLNLLAASLLLASGWVLWRQRRPA
ncbi:hypothetical protein GTP23_02385 [Pseudoduganella sp. FT93W]|uniref:Uncharacterized protein n=1 Tax=Duganella fentianensis TaxID=2692177 RepID=A0A845HWG5_9BURK|nr:hypothetical protein [Duganella fentianensis]MYN43915.1 hypothetical protein [Duganella fentianensis]